MICERRERIIDRSLLLEYASWVSEEKIAVEFVEECEFICFFSSCPKDVTPSSKAFPWGRNVHRKRWARKSGEKDFQYHDQLEGWKVGFAGFRGSRFDGNAQKIRDLEEGR